MTNLERGDLKYYWQLHVQKKRADGENPVSYSAFVHRIHKMSLHDAIHKDRVEYNVRDSKPKTPIQDAIRRRQINKEENIQILTFEEIEKVEEMSLPKNRINMKPQKKSFRSRFKSFFKK